MATVNADEELVFVKKPIIFGSGGVDSEPLTSGSQWRWFSTDEVIFKVSPIQYEEEFKDIFTSDNTPINLSANLLLQIEKGSTPKLLTDFGEKWYDNNIQVQFVKYVRDEISKYPMKELTSKREIYDNVEMVVNEKVQQIIKDKKIPVNVLAVVVNRAVPKDDVMEELTRTAIQIQAQETQEQREKTESKREAAEIKRAQADKAYQREMSLTADQYIKLRALEIEKEKVEMIKNKQNVKINMLMGNGAQPIYDVNY
ncbi:MAG: SPFH domain / Band 7 family protein [Bacteriophage sp.]|nr:MAG: SPFH domain / band 7 family protein [Bacteriophage sp.]UVY03204.1 MAG: SPFH domain / Band 7 family protein [Bacteriophage sp.]UWD58598.1 MAG: SPFH domain / Band 7 family protein [Bacteriophage sp.]UWF82176.1 MAG: SPFH domain / Band 7 family protein [Bacteriophage sp.]